jgi:hypothetical protein
MRMRAAVIVSSLFGSVVLPGAFGASLLLAAQSSAEATLTVSLSAQPSTYVEGGSTRLSGTADGAKLGSVVKLQKKRADSWTTIAQRTLRDSRAFSFTVSPARGYHTYRVAKDRQLGQPRVVSRSVVVTVTWRPTIAVTSTGALDPAGDVWITTVKGTTTGLRGVTLAVQRYAYGAWSAAGESVSVGSGGQFSHVITGGTGGTRYRYVSPASGLRLPARSEPVSVAAEVYTPTVGLTVRPIQEVSGPDYDLVYHQDQRVTGATNAPDAPVSVQVYEYRDNDLWVWSRYWSGTTATDGSFTANLPNLPEGTKIRAIVEPSADGLRKRAVSDEVATTLVPIEFTLDGPQIDVYDVTRDRGTLVEMEATAGDLITFDFADANPAGVSVSWQLYGPDGTEVPEQQYVRASSGNPNVSRYFRPTTTGTHTLVLTSDSTDWPSSEDVRITASTPKVVPITIDQQQTVSTWRPEQLIDLEFTGLADQAIGVWPNNVEASCPTAQLYIGDQLVPRRFASLDGRVEMQSAWELPLDGTYHLRLWPCNDAPLAHTITLVSPEEVQLEFGHDTRIDLSRRGAYGIASFTTTAGKHIQLELVDWYFPGSQGVVVAPDGSLIQGNRLIPSYDFVAPQTGTYKLWVSPGSQSTSHAVWRATESNS